MNGHHHDDECPPVRVITGDKQAIIEYLTDEHDHRLTHAHKAEGLDAAERDRMIATADGIAEALEVLDDWRQIEPRDVLAALVSLCDEAKPADSEFVIIHRSVAPAFAAELLVRALAHAADHPFPDDAEITPLNGESAPVPDQGGRADHHGESVPRGET
jgi:hypothetical protein